MPFIVKPSDQIVISGETTADDFLRVALEDGSEIYLRDSIGTYSRLTIDLDFVPPAVRTLARKAAKSWLIHRSRSRSQDEYLQAAFDARPNKSQRLVEFIASALLETITVRGSSWSEVPTSWQAREFDFNIGKYPSIMFGRELRFPGIEEPLRSDNSFGVEELIIPSRIIAIVPLSRWQVELRWALR